MPESDPMVFAAKVAALTDQQLADEWAEATQAEDCPNDWGQALLDELAQRQVRC